MQEGSPTFPEDGSGFEPTLREAQYLPQVQTARKPGERRLPSRPDWEMWMSMRGHTETNLAQHLLAAEHALRMMNAVGDHLLMCFEEVLCEVLADTDTWRVDAVKWINRETPWVAGEELVWHPKGLEVVLLPKHTWSSSPTSARNRGKATTGLRWNIPLHPEPGPFHNPPAALADALKSRPGWWEELQSEGRWQWAKHRERAQLAYRAYRQHELQFLAESEPWKSVWAQILMSGRVVQLQNHACTLVREASRWPLAPAEQVPHCIGMTLPKPRSAGWQVREFRVQATLRSGSQWKIYGIRESFDPQRGVTPFPFETTVAPGILLDALLSYLFPWPSDPFSSRSAR